MFFTCALHVLVFWNSVQMVTTWALVSDDVLMEYALPGPKEVLSAPHQLPLALELELEPPIELETPLLLLLSLPLPPLLENIWPKAGHTIASFWNALSVGLDVGLLVLGLAVGDTLGLAVGLAVGDAVGVLVGLAVGDTLGLAVGLPVGLFVGLPVGATPEPELLHEPHSQEDEEVEPGLALGLADGAADGLDVGLLLDGEDVGAALDGRDVGLDVGALDVGAALDGLDVGLGVCHEPQEDEEDAAEVGALVSAGGFASERKTPGETDAHWRPRVYHGAPCAQHCTVLAIGWQCHWIWGGGGGDHLKKAPTTHLELVGQARRALASETSHASLETLHA